MKKFLAMTAATSLLVGGSVLGLATLADAHVPSIKADCDAGLVLHATDYDGNALNVWSYTVGDKTDSGTFGASFDKQVSLPQGGATTHVVAHLAAADGGYSQDFSQDIGPCGTITTAILPATHTDPTCTAGYTYTLPELTAGLKYSVNADGTRPVAGTFSLAAGQTVTVVEHTISGYTPASETFVFVGADKKSDISCFPPLPCVTSGGYFISPDGKSDEGDRAPKLTPAGYFFQGPGVVDLYQRATGNAQGITSFSITYAAGGSGEPAQGVIEINRYGTTGYATLSANLTGAEATGTVNLLDPSHLWSTTKILTGPGSLSQPLPYTDLVALFPANTLVSGPSFHLLSGSTTNDKSTIASVSSNCGTGNFVPAVPETTTRTTDTNGEVTCTVDENGKFVGGGSYDEVITHFTTRGVWNEDTQKYDLVETTDEGYPQTVTHTTEASLDSCPFHVTPVPATVPAVSCGIDPSGVLPANTEFVSYAFINSSLKGATLVATPAANTVIDATDGFIIQDDGTAQATLVYPAKVACDVISQLTALATTGSAPMGWVYLAYILLLAGLTIVGVRLVRRHNRLRNQA